MSEKLLEKAKALIPTGSQTYSKSWRYFTRPFLASYGEDGFLYDTDRNKYHDFNMALGTVILGYKSKSWLQELNIPDGFIFSAPHELETQLAEKLIEIIPSVEMVKFFKNGSDATEIAVRLARAYTKRHIVIAFGYHGFHDWYVTSIDRNKGVEFQNIIQAKSYENLKEDLSASLSEIACVILEPNTLFTHEIVALARENGALVIFDEVLTGFRYHIGGYQSLIKIVPDLSCFGKCMANGLPLSAVVGKKEIMQLMDDGGVFASSTFGGDTVALAAALRTIEELQANGNRLWQLGGRWITGMNMLIRGKRLEGIMRLDGLAPRCGVVFNDEAGITAIEYQSLYQQELLKRGVLTHGINNYCLVHTQEQIDYFIEKADEALDIVKKAMIDNTVKGYLERTIQTMFKR